jgi:hypothetical protein
MAENLAPHIVIKLDALLACRLAMRHPRNGARDRRRDATRAAIGAASALGKGADSRTVMARLLAYAGRAADNLVK